MTEKLPGELVAPPDATIDAHAVEMLRAWIVNDRLQIALRMGASSADPSEFEDERLIWGRLLADAARHIANALEQSGEYDRRESIELIRDQFNGEIDLPRGSHHGDFVDK